MHRPRRVIYERVARFTGNGSRAADDPNSGAQHSAGCGLWTVLIARDISVVVMSVSCRIVSVAECDSGDSDVIERQCFEVSWQLHT